MARDTRTYAWPAGKQCAAVFSADVDAESPYLWANRGQPIETLGQLELRRFGPRVGLNRLLDLLDRFEIKGSFYVPGIVAETYDSILPDLVERGHEVGLHGYYHERVDQISEAENAAILDRCLDLFGKQVGLATYGYRSPSWELTPGVHELLRERGLTYDSSLMGYDHPYSIEGMVEIPVQWLTDDAIYFRFFGGGKDAWHPASPRAVLESWIEEFEGIRQFGGLFMITVHPWISGRAQRVRMLQALFEHIARYDDVWWATAAEIAAYHASSANAALFEEPLRLADTNF